MRTNRARIVTTRGTKWWLVTVPRWATSGCDRPATEPQYILHQCPSFQLCPPWDCILSPLLIAVLADNAGGVPELEFLLFRFSFTHFFFFSFRAFSEVSIFPEELFEFKALGFGFRFLDPRVFYQWVLGPVLGRGNVSGAIVSLASVIHFSDVWNGLEPSVKVVVSVLDFRKGKA